MADIQQSQAARPGTAAQPQRPGAPEPQAAHDRHGQSLASWVAVGIIMFGALIMCIAVVVATVWLFVVGAVIAAAGAGTGVLLAAMGFGVRGRTQH